MTKKKQQPKARVVKETFLGKVDLVEYFRALLVESISKDT